MRTTLHARWAAVALITGSLAAAAAMARAATDVPLAPASAAGDGDDGLVTMNVFPHDDVPVWHDVPSGPDQADITRPVSESWENERVFDRNSAWRTFDPFVSQPSLNDEIKWGRRNCKATVGSWGLWSVGGGSVGGLYACDANYPSPLPNRPSQGIRTELQYLYMDFRQVPAAGGLRVTLDYMARMPDTALFVGAGDFDNRNPDGSIPIRGSNTFQRDTQGDWIRGHRVEVRNSADFVITGKQRVLFAMVYSDPPSSGGNGVPSSGNYGVYVDNVHLDAMFVANPGVIPSHTVPVPDTPTFTPVPTGTATGIIFPTRAPTRRHYARMPAAYNRADLTLRTPVPTAPTPTVTPTPVPPTPTATTTPLPTETPTVTPVPSSTPVPQPDVRFDIVAPLGDPEIVRVRNFGTLPQDLTNWRVFAFQRAVSCYFPGGLVLGPDQTHEIQSGGDSVPGPGVTVCNDSRLMWDNNEDEAQLWNQANDKVDVWCYDRFGPLPCEGG